MTKSSMSDLLFTIIFYLNFNFLTKLLTQILDLFNINILYILAIFVSKQKINKNNIYY